MTGTEVLAGAASGATAGTAATGAAALAVLIAAERFFAPAMIARLPAALIFRFAGAAGPTVSGGFESCSTDGSAAFRPGPGGLPFVSDLEGPRSPLLFCLSHATAGRGYQLT